jgi:hypothetical protein
MQAYYTYEVAFVSARRKLVALYALLGGDIAVSSMAKSVHVSHVWHWIEIASVAIPGLHGSDLAREHAVREVIVDMRHILSGVRPKLDRELSCREYSASLILSDTIRALCDTVASSIIRR